MAQGQINLHIGTSYDGGGFAAAAKNIKNVGQATTRSAELLGNLGAVLGGTSKAAQAAAAGVRILGAALSGGVWGLASAAIAAVVKGIVDLCTWFKRSNEEGRLAALGIQKEFTTAEAMARGYQRRVEGYKKAAAERAAAEKEAEDAAKKAAEAANKAAKEAIKSNAEQLKGERAITEELLRRSQVAQKTAEDVRKSYAGKIASAEADVSRAQANREHAQATATGSGKADYEYNRDTKEAVAEAQDKLAALLEQQAAEVEAATRAQMEARQKAERLAAENAVANAKDRLATTEGQAAGSSAWQALRLAEEKLVTLRAKQAQEIAEYNVVAAAERDQIKARIEATKERTVLEEEIAKRENEIVEMNEKAAAEINALKKAAAEWEANAVRARGETYVKWDDAEKSRNEQAAREQKKQAAEMQSNERYMNNLADRIFDRDGNIRKSANQHDVNEWKKRKQWAEAQDEKNNPAQKALKEAQEKWKDSVVKAQADLELIKKQLEHVGL